MQLKISVCLVSLNWQREVGRAEATKQARMELWLPNFCSFEWMHRLQGASEKQFPLERHLSNIRPVMDVYFCKERVYFLDLCVFVEIKTIYSLGILQRVNSKHFSLLLHGFKPIFLPWIGDTGRTTCVLCSGYHYFFLLCLSSFFFQHPPDPACLQKICRGHKSLYGIL